jgi:hypothetical protein
MRDEQLRITFCGFALGWDQKYKIPVAVWV